MALVKGNIECKVPSCLVPIEVVLFIRDHGAVPPHILKEFMNTIYSLNKFTVSKMVHLLMEYHFIEKDPTYDRKLYRVTDKIIGMGSRFDYPLTRHFPKTGVFAVE